MNRRKKSILSQQITREYNTCHFLFRPEKKAEEEISEIAVVGPTNNIVEERYR